MKEFEDQQGKDAENEIEVQLKELRKDEDDDVKKFIFH